MSEHVLGVTPNVRLLTAADLGLDATALAGARRSSTAPDAPVLEPDHPTVMLTMRLADDYGGVIFTGPPGTSKTFMAAETGRIITGGDPHRLSFVQFHASYQYEDFMYGFMPVKGGFAPRLGVFLSACDKAIKNPDEKYVIVIDELSRADVGRVFGEALTYVDRTKRGKEFTIASGEKWRIPSNLIVLATMNPQDRGVDEVDAAFERRFAKISMEPDADQLAMILAANGAEETFAGRVVGWFHRMNGHTATNSAAAVGHAYFVNVVDEPTLRDVWEHQLKFLVQRAFRLDKVSREEMVAAWERIFVTSPEPATPADPESVDRPDTPADATSEVNQPADQPPPS